MLVYWLPEKFHFENFVVRRKPDRLQSKGSSISELMSMRVERDHVVARLDRYIRPGWIAEYEFLPSVNLLAGPEQVQRTPERGILASALLIRGVHETQKGHFQ